MLASCDDPGPAAFTTAPLGGSDAGTAEGESHELPPPEGALEALEELRLARHDAGLVSTYDRTRASEFVTAPGFDLDGLSVVRSPRGQIKRISGWPYLVELAPSKEVGPSSDMCDEFLQRWGGLWGLPAPGVALRRERSKQDNLGGLHCLYRQTFQDVPVDRTRLVVHLNGAGQVTSVNGEPLIHLDESTAPTLSAASARNLADLAAPDLTSDAPLLVIHSPAQHGIQGAAPRLAWKTTRRDTQGHGVDHVWVSAHTGEVLHEEALERKHHAVRQVWDAEGQSTLGGTLRFQNDPPFNDGCDVNPYCTLVEASQSLVSTMWHSVFDRHSYDGTGGTMKTAFNYGPQACGHARSWGDGWISLGLDMWDRDLIMHEYGHEMERAETEISYSYQGAAISEHFADMHDMWGDGHYTTPDWTLRVWCHVADEGTSVVRRYDDPPAPGTIARGPDSWRWFEPQSAEAGFNWASHQNAGILNKLAYLLHREPSEGSVTHHGVAVTGIGLAAAQWVFYDAVDLHMFDSGADLHDYRDALRDACVSRYGALSTACVQLDNAWNAVGLWSPPQTVAASIGSRLSAYSWKGWGGSHWLYVFYRSAANNDIKWRWVDAETGYWGPEQTVSIGGSVPQTNRPVAVAPVRVDSTTGERLYVFYKEATTNQIKYFRMTPTETFEGIGSIPTGLASTDLGPGAASTILTGGRTTVLFKKASVAGLGMVWRPNDPIGSWQAGLPPPSSTSMGDPYMTDIAGIATVALFNRPLSGRLMYAFNSGDDWWHYPEPPGSGTAPGMGEVAPGPYLGNRQYSWGPYGWWDYGPPYTLEGGTIAWWRSGYVVAHRELSTNVVRNQVRAPPRFAGGSLAWGPMVPQPAQTTVSPLLVRTHHKSGLQRALWMVERVSNSQIRWREAKGGQ
jgi:bacillolysin